jgi:hypothetical protein
MVCVRKIPCTALMSIPKSQLTEMSGCARRASYCVPLGVYDHVERVTKMFILDHSRGMNGDCHA